MISGAQPGTHFRQIIVLLEVLTLLAMLVLDCICFVKLNISSYIVCSGVHVHATRKNLNLFIDHHKYGRTHKCFEVDAINVYNVLPISFRSLPTSSFRLRLRVFQSKASIIIWNFLT